MPITALPTPPSRTDSPEDFSTKADALLGALPVWVTESNALAVDVSAKQATASAAASTATTQAATASAAAASAAAAAAGVAGLASVSVSAPMQAVVMAPSLAGARTALGASTVGAQVFTAADQAAARTALGASSVGGQVFTAGDQAAAVAALGLTPPSAALSFAGSNGTVAASYAVIAPKTIRYGANVLTGAGKWVENLNIAAYAATVLVFADVEGIASTYSSATGVNLFASSFSYPALKFVFDFSGFGNLVTAYAFPQLQVCMGAMQLNGQSITSISLPALEFAGGLIVVSPVLTALSAPSLATIMGNCSVQDCTLLTSLSLPVLQRAGYVGVVNNPAITAVSFPALTTVDAINGSGFSIYNCPLVTSITAPALAQIQALQLGFLAVTTVSLPALTRINANISITSCANLTSLSLPALQRIVTQGITFNSGTAALSTFTLPTSLVQLGGNVIISSAALTQASVDNILVRLAALDGTAGTTAYSSKTVTLTGTSAAPSATGLAAKATLQGRGCTVTHN